MHHKGIRQVMIEQKRKYSTVDNDAALYKEIAEIMTEIGFSMNHSCARNHVIYVMEKFAKEFSKEFGKKCKREELLEIARNPEFQTVVAELVYEIISQEEQTI